MAYVYRHIRLDKNEPFYIGIGIDNGFSYHRAYSKKNRNKIWHLVTNKTPYEVEILIDGVTWKEAGKKEKEFIKLYGRINTKTGILSNLTDGGDGNVGLITSEETRTKMSLTRKGTKRSPDAIEKTIKYHLGKKRPKETGEKISKAKKGKYSGDKNPFFGKKHTLEYRQKKSESLKGELSQWYGKKGELSHSFGRKLTLEQRLKISECTKGEKNPFFGKKHDEETRKLMSASKKNKKPVMQYALNGDFMKEFTSIREASLESGCHKASITSVCKGISKSGKGYIWKYKSI